MNKQKVLSNVAFSFTYGLYDDKLRKELFGIFIVIAVAGLFGVTLYTTMTSIEYVKEQTTTLTHLLVGLFSLIGGFAIGGGLILALALNYERDRKKILLCLDDAVELTAFTKTIGTTYYGYGTKVTKLQVEFEYNGLMVVRTTENEVRSFIADFGRPVGYFPKISKYADRTVKILYSPQYDHVLVLKS